MSGGMELGKNSGRHFDFALVAYRLEMREGTLCGHLVVERQRGSVTRVMVLVRLSRVFLLDPAGVRQHQTTEILGARGAEDATGEPLGDEPRQVSDMVQV